MCDIKFISEKVCIAFGYRYDSADRDIVGVFKSEGEAKEAINKWRAGNRERVIEDEYSHFSFNSFYSYKKEKLPCNCVTCKCAAGATRSQEVANDNK